MKLSYLEKPEDSITVSEAVFSHPCNDALVHQVVVSSLAAARSGTKAQKTRSQVSGGGKKPWKQKGTGRARAGSIRSPLWRGGGIIHASVPRDHSNKVNRKMYRGAIIGIFTQLVKENRFFLINPIDLSAPKTKILTQWLKQYHCEDALFLIDSPNINLELSARNIPSISISTIHSLTPVQLLSHKKLLVTESVVRQIERWLS